MEPATSSANISVIQNTESSGSRSVKDIQPVGRKAYVISGPVVVSDLANELGIKSYQLVANLIKIQIFAPPHHKIDPLTVARICEIHDHPFVLRLPTSKELKKMRKLAKTEIMDHVPIGTPIPIDALDSGDIQQNESANETFELRKGVFVRSGNWIQDSTFGIGKIIRLNTDPNLQDSHDVWFASLRDVEECHQLLGRTTSILHESKIPEDIRLTAPFPSI